MRFIGFMALLMLTSPVMAEEKTDDKILCGTNTDIEKVLNDKGYRHFLDMKTDKNLAESLWLGGQQMVATYAKDDQTSCLLTIFKGVTLNPKTIETIYTVLKSTQKEL